MATIRIFPRHIEQVISIHATHTGGDGIAGAETGAARVISIHATHTGGDARVVLKVTEVKYFNPRHPYGWRRK